MKIVVWCAVFLAGMGLGGRLARNIGNLPIEQESVAGAARQSLLGLVIIGGSVLAASFVTRVVF
jgi:hypothetical protein